MHLPAWLYPFPSRPCCPWNVVVEKEMHLVPKIDYLRPFGSIEWLQYVDCIVGEVVRWRSNIGHWIGWIDGGDEPIGIMEVVVVG